MDFGELKPREGQTQEGQIAERRSFQNNARDLWLRQAAVSIESGQGGEYEEGRSRDRELV